MINCLIMIFHGRQVDTTLSLIINRVVINSLSRQNRLHSYVVVYLLVFGVQVCFFLLELLLQWLVV